MLFRKLRSSVTSSRHIWAVAYLFFNAFPHFDALTHSHSHGGAFHTHGFTTSHDLALERAAFAALTNDGSELPLPTAPSDPEESPHVPIEAGTQGIKAGGSLFFHSHYQEDPNLAALGVAAILALILLGLIHRMKLPPIPFFARQALNPSARGPPAFLLSA